MRCKDKINILIVKVSFYIILAKITYAFSFLAAFSES